MALVWAPHIVATVHFDKNVSDGRMTFTWSDGITDGSPAFQYYSIWTSNSSQAACDNRSGDTTEINDGDIAALGIIGTRTVSYLDSESAEVWVEGDLIFFSIFGYDGVSYSSPLHMRSSGDGAIPQRLGATITAVSQLTSDEDTGFKGDLKITFKLVQQFNATLNLWMEFRDANDNWQSCTRIVGATGVDLTAVPDNTTKIIYWLEPQEDLGSITIADLQIRLYVWETV